MYHVYIKGSGLMAKKLVGEFRDYDKAFERVEAELAKDENIKYVVEETTGQVDSYGELIASVIDEN